MQSVYERSELRSLLLRASPRKKLIGNPSGVGNAEGHGRRPWKVRSKIRGSGSTTCMKQGFTADRARTVTHEVRAQSRDRYLDCVWAVKLAIHSPCDGCYLIPFIL